MKLSSLIAFELKKLVLSKSTWLLLAIFACLSNASAFFLGGFLVLNKASMQAFLQYQPFTIIIFCLLLSFINNNKDNKKSNLTKLASMPISLNKLTIAKFLANSIIGIKFIVISSASYIATIYYLGSPDTLLLISGILGSIALMLLCFAIASFANNITNKNLESLGLSLLIIFLLCLVGMGAITTILKPILPAVLIEKLAMLSFLNVYANFASGYVTLADIILVISLITVFIFGALIYANKNIVKVKLGKTKLIALLAILIIINLMAYNTNTKFDLTNSKKYSISQNLINIINKIEGNNLKITFYYSNANENIPLEYQRLIDYTHKYLEELETASANKIKVYYKNIEESERFELEAVRDKMLEIPLANNDVMYAGIAIRRGTELERIPYITTARKQFLEYDIAAALVKFTKNKKAKKIGILTDLDLGTTEQSPAFLRELLKRYEVDLIPMTYPAFPQYDLVISFMTPFSEPASLYAADQYLVNGGHMLMLFDPFFRTAPEDDFLMPDRRADDSAFDHLADLLRFYGIEYDYNTILGDNTQAMVTNVPGIGTTSYPLWTLFTEQNMNKNSPILANLNNMVIPEGGFFEVYDLMPTVEYTPLLTSSANSQIVSRALFNTLQSPKDAAARLNGEKKSRDVAFMINGTFISAFKKMPDSVKEWFEGAESLEGAAKVPEHKVTTDNKGVLIAIADMDFMADQFSTYAEKNIDGTINKKPATDNQFFLTNTIDYLMGDYDLIALRSKGDSLRTLTKVEKLIVNAIDNKGLQENALSRDIELKNNQYEELKKRLNIAKTKEDFFAIKSLLSQKEEDIIKAKRKLRFYKRELKGIIESYMQKVALINILFAPLLLLIVGLCYFGKRRYRNS